MELLLNAIVSGLLLGGFYAAVALGLAIAFGQLDIVNIAHPAFVIVGSYVAYMMNGRFGLDPVLSGLLFTPVFFLVGAAIYRVYYASFERTGQESLSGLAFFFGLMFIIEVAADHDLWRRLPAGRRPLHRPDLRARADPRAAAHAGAVRAWRSR